MLFKHILAHNASVSARILAGYGRVYPTLAGAVDTVVG